MREYAFWLVKASFHKSSTFSHSVIASDTALLREKPRHFVPVKTLYRISMQLSFDISLGFSVQGTEVFL
jgi:hypothetical protein